jgi:hypothetical protein
MLPNLFFLAMMQGTTPPSLTAREILETHMVQADNDGLPPLPDTQVYGATGSTTGCPTTGALPS